MIIDVKNLFSSMAWIPGVFPPVFEHKFHEAPQLNERYSVVHDDYKDTLMNLEKYILSITPIHTINIGNEIHTTIPTLERTQIIFLKDIIKVEGTIKYESTDGSTFFDAVTFEVDDELHPFIKQVHDDAHEYFGLDRKWGTDSLVIE